MYGQCVVAMIKKDVASAESILMQTPGLMVWKDRESRYYGCNERFAQLTGFGSPEHAADKFDYDMQTPSAECSDIFRAQDQLVLQHERPLALIDLQQFVDGQNLVVLTRKTPLYGDNKNVVGTICHLTEITDREMLKISHLMLQKDKSLRPSSDKSYVLQGLSQKLTPREAESLFYILRGKSSRHIGEMLQISKRTVEAYTDNLKTKFDCQSKAELIEKAIADGYLNFIPDTLLNSGFSETLSSI